ncbi:MAG: leucyl aminopeptidase [Synergistaceae bacterium]|jgi:leucyl aminopeptidase|nr:leucyl aminopeptidase [Synergistaceae bacterium]
MKFEVLEDGARIRNKNVLGIALYEDFSQEDLLPLPSSLALLVKMEIPRENFKAKKGTSLIVPLADGETQCIVLAGMGKREEACLDDWRIAAFMIARTAASRGASSVSIAMPDASGKYGGHDRELSRCIGSGVVLAGYRFEKYRTQDQEDRFRAPDVVEVLGADISGLEEGRIVSAGQCWARDMANEPGNVINPGTFEQEARRLAESHGLEIGVLDASELERRGMNALLSVGRGSATPPRLIHLTYRPEAASKGAIALVGKGITFDSGGLSIKPADSMVTMKGDKTGACVVLAAVKVASELKLPLTVHAITGVAENMPGGGAYRPDDIIRAYNGKTIEVNNTDAEGRLTLADALAYASELEPDAIIDIATLTGACAVALGDTTAGLFTNDERLGTEFLSVTRASGERFWKLPMDDENLRKKVKSSVADVVNSAGRYGGAITAAMFLENFVKKGTPWIHLDIAATDFAKEAYSYYTKGATAFGMRTIARFLIARAGA